MKIHLNSRVAVIYPHSYSQMEELKTALIRHKVDLYTADEEALGLSLAQLVGFLAPEEPTKAFGDEAPEESCLVLSGMSEGVLNRVLDTLRNNDVSLDFKAVMTPTNRDWTLGALIEEMRDEKAINDAATTK